MRHIKISLVALLVITTLIIFLPHYGYSSQEFGVGAKLVGETPLIIASFDSNQFGIEAGGWTRSANSSYGSYSLSMSLTYYLANGRFIIPIDRQIKPYVGAGIVGVLATGRSSGGTTDVMVNGGANGYDLFGGLEYELDSHGLPISIFGGANYIGFGDITFTYDGESFSYPVQIGGTSFHFGVKFEF